MKCVVLQPSYIPWRGYFHQIYKADTFVFYDDVQYDKHGWRNRNRVKTQGGSQWLTIPVIARGVQENHITIDQVRISPNENWNKKHWMTLRNSYGKAPFFSRYSSMLEESYATPTSLLADFTITLTIAIAKELGIKHTRFLRSSSLGASGARMKRLIQILKLVGATHYISGPAARDYLEEDKLAAAGISLEYMVYVYPEYAQLYPPFDPQVSVLDLMFMKGPDAGEFIWGNHQCP
jgi:hypothetical protein